jgi:hypothetical protein
VISTMLTQENEGKEFIVAYFSRRLVDTEVRYTPIKKLCLALYYACIKNHHYLLSSSCTIVCQYDVIKNMLQNPILSGRMGKWAYTLMEYDLKYELLRAVKGQVLADFITDHHVRVDNEQCEVMSKPC